MKTLVVIGFLALIVYNLGAALFYMLTDRGESKRAVNALTWRLGLSMALIALVAAGIGTGVIQPHAVGA